MIIANNNKTNFRIADFSFDKTVSMTPSDGKLSVAGFKSLFSITSNNFVIQATGSYNSWEYEDVFLGNVKYALVTEDKPNVFQIYYNGAYVGEASYINVGTTTTLYIYNLI